MELEKIFESNRIVFINLSELYIDDYIKMYTDSNIQKSLFKKEYDYDTIINWIKKEINEKEKYSFSMIDKSTKEFIGNIEIVQKEEAAEIMISITPSKQGKHYATEAIGSIIEFGQNELGISQYDLNVYKNNGKAVHIYKKAGFIEDGNNLTDDSIHMKL